MTGFVSSTEYGCCMWHLRGPENLESLIDSYCKSLQPYDNGLESPILVMAALFLRKHILTNKIYKQGKSIEYLWASLNKLTFADTVAEVL